MYTVRSLGKHDAYGSWGFLVYLLEAVVIYFEKWDQIEMNTSFFGFEALNFAQIIVMRKSQNSGFTFSSTNVQKIPRTVTKVESKD